MVDLSILRKAISITHERVYFFTCSLEGLILISHKHHAHKGSDHLSNSLHFSRNNSRKNKTAGVTCFLLGQISHKLIDFAW
jgi:hypothetical protein